MGVYYKGTEISPIIKVKDELFKKVVNGSITNVIADDLLGITQLRDYAFYNMPQLLNVTLPNTVTTIGTACFSTCRAMLNFNAPDVSTYGNVSFSSCRALKKFVFYPATSQIGVGCLNYCDSLIAIIVDKDTPPTLSSNLYTDVTPLIYVKNISAYEQATNWIRYVGSYAPLVDTITDLNNIDTNTYKKACVKGTGDYKLYEYDGSAWNEVTL